MDIKTDPKAAARKAVDVLGGPVNTARVILGDGKKYQTVQGWINTRVPAEHCPRIERETTEAGQPVMCEEMRADVDWAYLRSRRPVVKSKASTANGGH